ncbi:MAG: hypothetical protein AABW72_05780 [archaeon]
MAEDATLVEIKDAEKKAELIILKAKEKAADIIREARVNGLKIMESADSQAEKLKAKALENASKEADDSSRELISANQANISNLKKSVSSNIGKESEFLVNRLVEGL